MKTFEDFLMDKFPFHSNNPNEAFEKWLSDIDIDALISYADEYKNKSLTNYHNHIVEKVNNELFDEWEAVTEIDNPISINHMRKDFNSLLQDTNPKE